LLLESWHTPHTFLRYPNVRKIYRCQVRWLHFEANTPGYFLQNIVFYNNYFFCLFLIRFVGNREQSKVRFNVISLGMCWRIYTSLASYNTIPLSYFHFCSLFLFISYWINFNADCGPRLPSIQILRNSLRNYV